MKTVAIPKLVTYYKLSAEGNAKESIQILSVRMCG
jgi:hypothetical protein